MNDSLLLALVKEGGFALLSAVMFLLYRHDAKAWIAKQNEQASAYMEFGERTAKALTQVSECMRHQSDVLARIEQHLTDSHMCPVTQLTTEIMRGPRGSQAKATMMRTVKQAIKDALDDASGE